jgi:protein TonB
MNGSPAIVAGGARLPTAPAWAGERARWLAAASASLAVYLAVLSVLTRVPLAGPEAEQAARIEAAAGRPATVAVRVVRLDAAVGPEPRPAPAAVSPSAAPPVRRAAPLPIPEAALVRAPLEVRHLEVASAGPTLPEPYAASAPRIVPRDVPTPRTPPAPSPAAAAQPRVVLPISASPPVAAVQWQEGGVTTHAAPAGELRPVYPHESIRRGEQGLVVVAAVVLADGRVSEATVHRSSGFARLDTAAAAAVAAARFTPARRDGRAVSDQVFLPIRFILNE